MWWRVPFTCLFPVWCSSFWGCHRENRKRELPYFHPDRNKREQGPILQHKAEASRLFSAKQKATHHERKRGQQRDRNQVPPVLGQAAVLVLATSLSAFLSESSPSSRQTFLEGNEDAGVVSPSGLSLLAHTVWGEWREFSFGSNSFLLPLRPPKTILQSHTHARTHTPRRHE